MPELKALDDTIKDVREATSVWLKRMRELHADAEIEYPFLEWWSDILAVVRDEMEHDRQLRSSEKKMLEKGIRVMTDQLREDSRSEIEAAIQRGEDPSRQKAKRHSDGA